MPTASDIVYMNRLVSGVRGVATVSGEGFATPISVNIRNNNELRIANFSALSIAGDMTLGYGSSIGAFAMNSAQPGVVFFNGRLTVGATMRLGGGSSLGFVDQNDGIVTVNQMVRVGDRHETSRLFPGIGRYNLSGVGVLNAARLELGYGGDSSQYACEGTFNLSGNATLNISLNAQIPDPKIGGGGGVGTLNQSGGTLNSPSRIISMASGGGTGVYNYSGGIVSIAGVNFSNTGGTINYTGGANLPLGQLQMTGGGQVLLTAGGNKTLRTNLLWVAHNSAVIDLNDNAMATLSVLEQLGGQSVRTLLSRGRNGGAWTGNGITSSAARDDANHQTAIGYALASQVLQPVGGVYTFNGQSVPGNATILKYTKYGDADLNGVVNFDDYVRIDTGFNSGGTDWYHGDFNYTGTVNFDDYALIDAAFNAQSGTTMQAVQWLTDGGRWGGPMSDPALMMVQRHYELFGAEYANAFITAVPEPGAVLLPTIWMCGVALRRTNEGRTMARGSSR